MPVLTRPAVLLAAASVAAGLIVAPSAAHASPQSPVAATASGAADTTTTLSAAEMAAAMKQVAAASTTAGAGGWRADQKYAVDAPGTIGSFSGTSTTVVDPIKGLFTDTFTTAGYGSVTTFAAAGRGVYESVGDPEQVAALKMMKRTAVKYAFTADPKLTLAAHVAENAQSPQSVAAEFTDAATRVAHADGTADYTAVDQEGAFVTLNVDATGALTGAHAELEGEDGASEVTLAYAYGPQAVTLPAASATIGSAALATGVAYLSMDAVVRTVANSGATAARKAAKGKKVKVTALRTVIRKNVTAHNRSAAVAVKVSNVTGGVKVQATNPWTRKTTAYTVKASGTKVVVKKA
ncbi:hypothetical protein AMIS_38130 [Actinoplanes missouriensis 431]|uniref:Uncharacterized protein n=1 Tax=Actinoplanes missouriensis (strain ATCC 14538 / DSM 43046 / CBS 188.64 / JCM 3121 / NBRC 102363 / NCIMB 12654 / NRRL B-3342 / UNCC 431) TaxID=512565 RepID=I0H7P6_ACTM4|nr:hypothetical protein [Actinoplanes missouriensis]BAL89033.1 hypothetical protein AMIS_38130 [Actinoplanes missouriensis 431]